MVSAQLSLPLDAGSQEQQIEVLRKLLKAIWGRALSLFWEDGEPLEPVQREARKLRDDIEAIAVELSLMTRGHVPLRDEKLLHAAALELEWYLRQGKTR